MRVVLVQPLHPGNVGAAARAMMNFGLADLVIVDPPAWDPQTARWMAPGCDALIARMRVVRTLDEALDGVHRAVAATARHRKLGQPVVTPGRLAGQILDAPPDTRTAIVFGREDTGLSNADVLRCGQILRIPTPEHASLNLGQAVLLVAWALFSEAQERGARFEGRTLGGSRTRRSTARASKPDRRDRLADLPEIEPAIAEIVGMLDRVGYLRGVQPDKVRGTARQALQRAGLAVRQVEALRGMVARVLWALDHPQVDWRATSKRDPVD